MSNFYVLMGTAVLCSGSTCGDGNLDQSGFFPINQCDCSGGVCNYGPDNKFQINCDTCWQGKKQVCTKSTNVDYDDVQIPCNQSCPAGYDQIGIMEPESGGSSCGSAHQTGGDVFMYRGATGGIITANCQGNCQGSSYICARRVTPTPPKPHPLSPPHAQKLVPPRAQPLHPIPHIQPLHPIPHIQPLHPKPHSLTPLLQPLQPPQPYPFHYKPVPLVPPIHSLTPTPHSLEPLPINPAVTTHVNWPVIVGLLVVAVIMLIFYLRMRRQFS